MLADHSIRRPVNAGWRTFAALCISLAVLMASSAAWAFAPDMLPSTAIWTNFMKKVHDKSTPFSEEDTTGDGVADFKAFKHPDGAYIYVQLKPGLDGMVVDNVVVKENLKDQASWVSGFDSNDDGQIDVLVRGQFAEGKWDQMLYDADRYGRPDRLLYDLDKNGVWDCMGIDMDADGKLDLLSDLDNKTGETINETVGWVTFEEKQRREALPQLLYSFIPELNTLTGQQAEVVNVTWQYGDGAVRNVDELVPGEHLYAEPGEYEVSLDVEFKVPGSDRTYKAWYGISLPVEAALPGPPPLTEERVKASLNTFYGACGFITATERPNQGSIAELWPEVKLPDGAPVGAALKASAVVSGELEVAIFWWRSEAEADAFLDAFGEPIQDVTLPALAVRAPSAEAFAIETKVRGMLLDKDPQRTAAFRENGFIVTLTTNHPREEAERWLRVFHDILHPPVKPEPTEAPAG